MTSETYTDRILSQSANATVPSHTIMAFTGNNIAPKGDTASRSLIVRLQVDRPDPENRSFRHNDPLRWTSDNRGKILACLYTILLGNPQLVKERRTEPRTRFKAWWNLVGAAVEHAARCLAKRGKDSHGRGRDAHEISFVDLFAHSESGDDEASSLSDVLALIDAQWPVSAFKASDLVELINNPPQAQLSDAAVLRDYFAAGGRGAGGTVPANGLGQRLQSIVDTPVYVGDRVMALRCGNPSGSSKRAATYKVRAV